MKIFIELRHNKGHCTIFNDSEEYIIHSLAVPPKKLRQGIGTILLNKSENIIKALGENHCALYVKNDNIWVHNWYKRCGYVDTTEKCDFGYTKMIKYFINEKNN